MKDAIIVCAKATSLISHFHHARQKNNVAIGPEEHTLVSDYCGSNASADLKLFIHRYLNTLNAQMDCFGASQSRIKSIYKTNVCPSCVGSICKYLHVWYMYNTVSMSNDHTHDAIVDIACAVSRTDAIRLMETARLQRKLTVSKKTAIYRNCIFPQKEGQFFRVRQT